MPETTMTAAILDDLQAQRVTLGEAYTDRADLSSSLVQQRPVDLVIDCKSWPVRNGGRYPKSAFVLNWEERTICCPNKVTVSFRVAGVVHFPTVRGESLIFFAYDQALELRCCLYDALYLALARSANIPLIYADEKLKRTIRQGLPLSLCLGDYQTR